MGILNPNMVFEFFLIDMLKRTNSSNEVPPAKRSRRLAGFHLARTASASVSSQSSSGSTSLFITVSQSDERCGILRAQNRVLASAHGPSTSPSSLSLEPHSQLPIDPSTAEIQDDPIPQDEPIHQEQQQTVKPKRKRNTTNAVCSPPNFHA